MPARSLTVALPCHSLDGLAAVEPHEAERFLTAWTELWHPAAIAAAGTLPGWSGGSPGLAAPQAAERPQADQLLPGGVQAEDFRALGLAVLLAEMLARRMRTPVDLDATGFPDIVLGAAHAAVDGEAGAQARLEEAFGCLEATRARYYPVESWVLDTVLLAASVSVERAVADLAGFTPVAVVATGATLERLSQSRPDLIAAVRAGAAAGLIEPCGGRDDEQPLDRFAPEAILESLTRGRSAWAAIGVAPPVCYAAIGGGSSALLPQMLTSLGYRAALWSLFDGSALPDPGGGRIRWESSGGAIEAVARVPLDASRTESVLAIPDTLGDAMDHDHVAVLHFARYAGGASRWHQLVRRIGRWTTLLGRFVTPSTLIDETAATATHASFEADAFPASIPVARDAIGQVVEAIAADARQLVEARRVWPQSVPAIAATRQRAVRDQPERTGLWRTLFRRGHPPPEPLRLDNGLVRVEANPGTGGLLSLRRPEDRANRLSQQLALRITRPARPGGHETADERAGYSRMEADAVERAGDPTAGRLVSRGRLVADSGQTVGRYRQRVSLVPGLPLAIVEIDASLERPLEGGLLEEHLACRFAWHENEAVELRRGIHLQSVATERSRFTAPHFIEIVPEGLRLQRDAVVILTGGWPWHLRTSPHVLDTVLAGTGTEITARVAVGVGLERPWEAALAVAAGERPEVGPRLPENVRLTWPSGGGSGGPRLRVGLVESSGSSGEVRIDWIRTVRHAAAVDGLGRPLPEVHVAVDGSGTVVFLNRHQWLHLDIEFAEPAPEPVGRLENSA